MPSRQLSTEGLLLKKTKAGESYDHCQIFSPTNGLILCLHRLSSRVSLQIQPDLFDRAELELEQSSLGPAWFIREYRVLERYGGIGYHYSTLLCASNFTALLLKNLAHAETFDEIYRLSLKAFQAWERGRHPETVLFKSLYLFARKEGYAIKQDWWHNLPSSDRERVAAILHRPIEAKGEPLAAVERLTESLQLWLLNNTDILISD